MLITLFVLFAYLYVIGCTLLVGFSLSVALCLLLHRTLRIGRKLFLTKLYLPCLALVCVASLWLSHHPVVTCDAETRSRMSTEEISELSSVGKGFYSRCIPLFPIWVDVKTIHEPEVCDQITVFYAYGGTVVYSHSDQDGFDCDKPLFPH